MSVQLSKEAKKLVHKLQKFLLAEPKRFDMSWWGLAIVGNEKKAKEAIDEQKPYGAIGHAYETLKHSPCGTVCCLAGSLCIMEKIVVPKNFGESLIYVMELDTWDKAAELLGITKEDASRLFLLPSEEQIEERQGYDSDEEYIEEQREHGIDYDEEGVTHWPFKWAAKYYAAKTPVAKTEVAVKYLDYVIANGL